MEITLLREYLADIQSELMSLVNENSNEKDADNRVSLDAFSICSLSVLLNPDKHSVPLKCCNFQRQAASSD